MGFHKLQEIADWVQQKNLPFWKVVMQDDRQERNVSEEESFGMMRSMYQAMREAAQSYSPELRSASGMAGGDGARLEQFRRQENRLIGDFLTEVMEKAVKMAESNACMKRIVAAPTAGSCGVIPAVLLTYEKQKETGEERMTEALFVAAGIGEVIAASASISGAEGGCQAEIGSASAIWEETTALTAPETLRLIQGTSTSPATGSQVSPSIFFNASAAAWRISSVLPPSR